MPRLVQINTWGNRSKWQLIKFLQEVGADFICLQEAIDCPGKNGGAFLTLDRIQQLSGCDYKLAAPFYSYRYGHEMATFGNAILSKSPFVGQNVVFTNLAFKRDFDFNRDDDSIRNLAHVIVRIGGQNVHILTYHGVAVSSAKADTPLMVRQTGIIARYIAELKGAVILATDLNVGPDSQAIAPLNQQLTNLTVLCGLETTRTPHTLLTGDVSDYIFVSRGVRVKRFYTSPRVVSDHVALILDFEPE